MSIDGISRLEGDDLKKARKEILELVEKGVKAKRAPLGTPAPIAHPVAAVQAPAPVKRIRWHLPNWDKIDVLVYILATIAMLLALVYVVVKY
jgi:hypothetical protein